MWTDGGDGGYEDTKTGNFLDSPPAFENPGQPWKEIEVKQAPCEVHLDLNSVPGDANDDAQRHEDGQGGVPDDSKHRFVDDGAHRQDDGVRNGCPQTFVDDNAHRQEDRRKGVRDSSTHREGVRDDSKHRFVDDGAHRQDDGVRDGCPQRFVDDDAHRQEDKRKGVRDSSTHRFGDNDTHRHEDRHRGVRDRSTHRYDAHRHEDRRRGVRDDSRHRLVDNDTRRRVRDDSKYRSVDDDTHRHKDRRRSARDDSKHRFVDDDTRRHEDRLRRGTGGSKHRFIDENAHRHEDPQRGDGDEGSSAVSSQSIDRSRHDEAGKGKQKEKADDENPTDRTPTEDVPGAKTLLPLKRKASDNEEEVVWPPVVIIENTRTGWDNQTNSWKGLENEEIRTFLKGVKDLDHGRVMALYGPRGHRGKSIVIFPPTYLGFMDAQALSECLQRDNRGREQWHRVAQGLSPFTMKGWCKEGLVTADGKRILYGYLATERDMLDADPKRKNVKRWCMESYAEKVLAPIKRTEQAKDEARKKREELAEEAKHKSLAVELKKSEFGKAAEEFKKINEESQLRKREEEEVDAMHRRNIEARRRQYEDERSMKVNQFQKREKEIRARLELNKIDKERDITQYEEAARHLKDGIDEEKKKHEVRLAEQKQIEMMEQMKLDSDLQAMMEEQLAKLEKTFHDKQLKLQEQHNRQIMESRKQIETDREKLLQSQLEELGGMENEVKVAKDATERIQQEVQKECIICFDEFGPQKRTRALYLECGHANVCEDCANDFWKTQKQKKEKPLCPTCKTVQKKKFESLPFNFKIYA